MLIEVSLLDSYNSRPFPRTEDKARIKSVDVTDITLSSQFPSQTICSSHGIFVSHYVLSYLGVKVSEGQTADSEDMIVRSSMEAILQKKAIITASGRTR